MQRAEMEELRQRELSSQLAYVYYI